MTLHRFHLLYLLLLLNLPARSQLVINEIMAANASYELETDFYNFSDWVEIYNSGTSALALGNYYLSDDLADLKKWKMPVNNLAAGAYYIVHCDKEDTGNHANFGLRTEGETLYLSDGSGNIVDYLEFGQQYPNVTFGRDPSDPGKLVYCATPTPVAANSPTSATQPGERVEFSLKAGRQESASSLSLSGNNVRYTTDCTEPHPFSNSFSDPISISKTMIVMARTFEEGFLPGEIDARTYFLNEHDFTLPVVSLSFEPDHFYDDMIGIHVRGRNGTAGYCGDVANWNQAWERPAYFEYFDKEGVRRISQSVGVKIAGGCTRGRDQKSLSIYARGKYGDNDFDYPFFVEKPDINCFPSLLLRNSGNDQDQTLLRDAFLQALVKPSMDIDWQSYQPAIVYFNGSYRGIMNLREKTNEDYLTTNYFFPDGEFDFLERDREIIHGTDYDYAKLLSFMNRYSLSDDENYRQVASKIDIQEFINWMTVHLYIGNRDWPDNNHKFWKAGPDGKWRWMLFDLDYGFGFRLDADGYKHETFEYFTAVDGQEPPRPPWSTLIFRKLVENNGFRKQFLATFLTHVYSSFEPEWCNYVLDSLSAVIDYEIYYNQLKYGRTKELWEYYLSSLKEYAVNRHDFIPGYVKSYFNLSSQAVTLTVSNPDKRKGKVKVNEAIIQMYPLKLQTYEELPMKLEALPEKGYRFSHWVDKTTGSRYSESIAISNASSLTVSLEPVFEPIAETDDVWLNELAPAGIFFNDEFGERSGFIELFNTSSEETVLDSWFLSDEKDNLMRFAIPDSTLIPAWGFITVYADGEARQGNMHTPFRLSTGEEQLYLSQKVGNDITIRDSASFNFLLENYSFGRYEDGVGIWRHMAILTPGRPNQPFQLKDGPAIAEARELFRVYPNPTGGQLFIEAEGGDAYAGDSHIDLVDITGKAVSPKIWLNQARNYLDVSYLDGGLYIIRIFREDRLVQTSRIILMK